jgi:hypothetical protein
VRLRTLVDKRQVLLARRGGAAKMTKESPSFYALYEGFRYFEKDLSKLQVSGVRVGRKRRCSWRVSACLLAHTRRSNSSRSTRRASARS